MNRKGLKTMSKVVAGHRLIEAVEKDLFMKDGTAENCDGIKYDFRLDSLFLKSEYSVPVDYHTLPPDERKKVVVAPGEVVFVLSKETLNLPPNVLMQLNIKRKMTEFGILTLGGLTVDPGYKGKLLFGLYNFTSDEFKLMPGTKLAGAVFYELEEDEIPADYTPPEALDGFSSTLVEKIKKYQPIGIKTLEDAVTDIMAQLETIKFNLAKNTNALETLESVVYQNSKQIKSISLDIGELNESLKTEVEARKNATKEFDSRIDKFKGALWLATAIGSAAVAILIGYLTGLFS